MIVPRSLTQVARLGELVHANYRFVYSVMIVFALALLKTEIVVAVAMNSTEKSSAFGSVEPLWRLSESDETLLEKNRKKRNT
jgi:hypothetical protein